MLPVLLIFGRFALATLASVVSTLGFIGLGVIVMRNAEGAENFTLGIALVLVGLSVATITYEYCIKQYEFFVATVRLLSHQ